MVIKRSESWWIVKPYYFLGNCVFMYICLEPKSLDYIVCSMLVQHEALYTLSLRYATLCWTITNKSLWTLGLMCFQYFQSLISEALWIFTKGVMYILVRDIRSRNLPFIANAWRKEEVAVTERATAAYDVSSSLISIQLSECPVVMSVLNTCMNVIEHI